MAEVVVLFGGGDGGGFIILNGKIYRIPPYNPETTVGQAQAVLNAVNSLVQAASVNKGLSHELTATAQKLSGEAVAQITKAIAPAQAKTA